MLTYDAYQAIIKFETQHALHKRIKLDCSRLVFEQELKLRNEALKLFLCLIERNQNEWQVIYQSAGLLEIEGVFGLCNVLENHFAVGERCLNIFFPCVQNRSHKRILESKSSHLVDSKENTACFQNHFERLIIKFNNYYIYKRPNMTLADA